MTLSSKPKRRGRPPKVETFAKNLEKMAYKRENEIEALENEIERLQIKIKNYEHQEIGWRAVVSYLEDKLGNA